MYQRIMKEYFGDIAEVIVDDLLVWGENKEQHDKKLLEVLERARKFGVKSNKEKLCAGEPEVAYVGHKLIGDGYNWTLVKSKQYGICQHKLTKLEFDDFLVL